MAFLLINITLVRDLKLNKIGLKYSTSAIINSNESLSSDQGIANFFGDEFAETGEEEEEGKKEKNEKESEDDIFYHFDFSIYVQVNQFTRSRFNYISFIPSLITKISTPPPRYI